MPFRFYIDGNLVDQPLDDRSLVTGITRDESKGGMLVTMEGEFTWMKDNSLAALGINSGYDALIALADSGICDQADLIITDQVTETETNRIFTGTINVRSMKIDRQQKLLSCQVQDNNFGAFINNNRNVEFNLRSIKTKSKENIDACQIYTLDLFDSASGIFSSAIGVYFEGYRLYDVFEYLISALSDNRVTFQSSFLSTLDPDIFLMNGGSLLNGGRPVDVLISFGKLFDEIRKLKDIGYYVDTTDPDAPILRIEQRQSLFSDAVTLTLDEEIYKLTTSAKTDKLYGTVRVGAEYNPGGSNLSIYTFNSGTSYFGWKEEVYTPIGQCNLDTEFDLMNGFIIASNAIQDQLMGQVDGLESDIFLIECENVDTGAFTADALRYQYFTQATPPWFYNLGLNNASKVQIHGNNFQTTVNNTQEIGGDGFKASLGADQLVLSNEPTSPVFGPPNAPSDTEPVIFADELTGSNYDGNGNYNNTTGVYVCPADGDYSFNAKIKLSFEGLKSCTTATMTVLPNSFGIGTGFYTGVQAYYGAIIRATINVYDDNTLTTLIARVQKTTWTFVNYLITNLNVNLAGTFEAGNAAVCQIEGHILRTATAGVNSLGQIINFPPVAIGSVFGVATGFDATAFGGNCGYGAADPNLEVYAFEDSYFECNGTPDGGISLSGSNDNGFKGFVQEFEYPLTASEIRLIQNNPCGAIQFTKDGLNYVGHIDNVQCDNEKGITTFKLLTSYATPT